MIAIDISDSFWREGICISIQRSELYNCTVPKKKVLSRRVDRMHLSPFLQWLSSIHLHVLSARRCASCRPTWLNALLQFLAPSSSDCPTAGPIVFIEVARAGEGSRFPHIVGPVAIAVGCGADDNGGVHHIAVEAAEAGNNE